MTFHFTIRCFSGMPVAVSPSLVETPVKLSNDVGSNQNKKANIQSCNITWQPSQYMIKPVPEHGYLRLVHQ